MSKGDKYTDKFKSNLTCIFLSVRAKLKKKKKCTGTLCKSDGCFVYYRDFRIRVPIDTQTAKNKREKVIESHAYVLTFFPLISDGLGDLSKLAPNSIFCNNSNLTPNSRGSVWFAIPLCAISHQATPPFWACEVRWELSFVLAPPM